MMSLFSYHDLSVRGDSFSGNEDLLARHVVVELNLRLSAGIGLHVRVPEEGATEVLEWRKDVKVFLRECLCHVVALESGAAKAFLTLGCEYLLADPK